MRGWLVVAGVLALGVAFGAARAQEGGGAPAARSLAPAAADAGVYKQAVPPYRFQFPRDHAAHPEYQTEWWYYTGHLASGERRFGYELTFFQIGMNPEGRKSKSAWALHTLYFAHFTVTDEAGKKFRFTEQISRPALGLAGGDPKRYHVWIDDWSADLAPDDRTHRLRASAEGFGIDLTALPLKPPTEHGANGVSQKSAGVGRASHYYSLTRMETKGTLTLEGKAFPVTGLSWMDHEFGSNQLTAEQLGWDWFSIQMEDGRELMLYVLRLKDGGLEPLSSGTLIAADGTWKHLKLQDFEIQPGATWKSPRTGAVYPAGWTVRAPSENIDLQIQPTVAEQEIDAEAISVSYWEGSCTVNGSAKGRAYVELTGYTGAVPGV